VARLVRFDLVQPIENPSFERTLFQHAVEKMLGDSLRTVFVYFLGKGSVLALAIGKFETALSQPRKEEIQIGAVTYLGAVYPFDIEKHVFPPIERAGGLTTKVARKLADTYVVTKQWDQQHLRLGEKAVSWTKLAKSRWRSFDEKYKVQEKVDTATKTTVAAVRAFDEKHQISRKVSDTAKQLDEKYDITAKVVQIKNNENVQKASNKVSQMVKDGLTTYDQLSKETKQLVNEKEAGQQKDEENKEVATGEKEGSEETMNEEVPTMGNEPGFRPEVEI